MNKQLASNPLDYSSSTPKLGQAGFCCCCPLMIPLIPFFALRFVVLKATGKL